MIDQEERFYTVSDVARALKISRSQVYAQIHSGNWECCHPSPRVYRFSQSQWDDIKDRTITARTTNRRRLDLALARLTA